MRKKYCIQNGLVFNEQGFFHEESLYFCGERIVAAREYRALDLPEEIVDARGGYVIPGLTDIHLHGCAGHDCCEGTAEAFQAIAEYELSCGVTSITPATMTMPEETLMKVARATAACSFESGAVLQGLYMEGPFLSPQKKGAQKEEHIRKPDIAMVERLQEASGGAFKTVAVAPETEGALEFIRALAGKATLSLAHTAADYDTALAAFRNGASQITHLYNAMPPMTHRAPGPIAAAADFAPCRAELICDGVHVHPAMVRAAFRLFGDDRILFISDSMEACGMPDGEYELGGQKVFVKGKRALLADGTIAGSVTNLMDCVRTAVREMGIPLARAVKCAAVNPAKAIGTYEHYGSLAPGKFADIVILNRELETVKIFRHGKEYRSCPDPVEF